MSLIIFDHLWSVEVQEFLRKELGEVQIRSVYLLKGFIFQPLDDFLTSRRLCKPPAELNPEPWQDAVQVSDDRVAKILLGRSPLVSLMPPYPPQV